MKSKSIRLIVISITILFFNVIIAFADIPKSDIELVDPQENTLSLNERFTRENFIIEASDFYNESVLITVYDGSTYDSCIPYCTNKVLSKTVAKAGDEWNVTDSQNITKMNIFIKELKEIRGNISANEGLNVVVDQRVKIRTTLVGQPLPKLSITPLERKLQNRTFIDRVFTPSSEISINFSIKNDGKAVLRGMHLIINKSTVQNLPFLFSGESIDRELPELAANDTTVINIRFKAPFVEKRRNINISASVTGKDEFGREYSVTDTTYIVVRPFIEKLIEVKKYVPEKIYMGDFIYVTLYVKNNGNENINGVNLIETIPAGFESLDKMWNLTNFTLKGNENKLIMYKLRPTKPGIYTFPEQSSIIEWKEGLEYNANASRLIVNGPYVELKKYGSIAGDNINVNINARNSGDMTAIVRLRDLIPNGTIVRSLVVRPGSTVTFSYTINKANVTISNEKIFLPRAGATILDQYLFSNERYTQRAMSNDLVLNTAGR